MKGTSATLIAHMSGPVTTLAVLVKLTRKDSGILAVTDHDTDIVFGGDTYQTMLGITASNVDNTAQLNVDNLEVNGFLSLGGIGEADISSGKWDYCAVLVQRVNWADLTMGSEKIKAGWIGQISQGRDTFTGEIRGLTQKLQQTIGEGYSPSCKANLFDTRCKVVATAGVWMFPSITVGVVSDPARTFASGALTQATDFFTAGKVTWTSGGNNGLSKEIKSFSTGGVVTLQEPMPYPITVGDQYTIFAGCTKRWQADCLIKFNNSLNFRGFPFVPGDDATLRGY